MCITETKFENFFEELQNIKFLKFLFFGVIVF